MSLTGKLVEGLSFPVCNQFRKVAHYGRPCYKIDFDLVAGIKRQAMHPGRRNGFLFAVDKGMSIHADNRKFSKEDLEEEFNLETEELIDYENAFTIHIDTLHKFSDTRPGRYVMSALKKMTTTSSFQDLPGQTKSCQIEAEEDCHSRRYRRRIINKSGCLPWALNTPLKVP